MKENLYLNYINIITHPLTIKSLSLIITYYITINTVNAEHIVPIVNSVNITAAVNVEEIHPWLQKIQHMDNPLVKHELAPFILFWVVILIIAPFVPKIPF